MTTNAFVGNVFLERGDGGSPETYTRVCQIFGIGGVGQTNALVDATTFCSEGSREYIPGLADGSEVTLNANFETAAFGTSQLKKMIDDVTAKATRAFQIVIDDGVNPSVTLSFLGACLSWELGPSIDNKNTINYTVKISGNITITVGS
jgi:hypothetical protein